MRIVRFNRPEARNAFNFALYDAVTDAITDAAVSSDVHVVVLTGTGSAFSAGQDLKEMAQLVTGRGDARGGHGVPGPARRRAVLREAVARRGERRGGGTRVHAAGPLRSRVHGRRRPPAGALRRARGAARGGQQLSLPAHHGMAARRPSAVHGSLDGGRGGRRRRHRIGALSRPSRCWPRPWPSPAPSRRHRSRRSWPASGCCWRREMPR